MIFLSLSFNVVILSWKFRFAVFSVGQFSDIQKMVKEFVQSTYSMHNKSMVVWRSIRTFLLRTFNENVNQTTIPSTVQSNGHWIRSTFAFILEICKNNLSIMILIIHFYFLLILFLHDFFFVFVWWSLQPPKHSV